MEGLAYVKNTKDVKNKWQKRADMLKGFIYKTIDRESASAYDVFRLLLPHLDTERGNYNLKEAALGSVYIDALGWEKSDPRANALIKWRDPATPGAGDLSAIMENIMSEKPRIANDSPIEERKLLKIGTINAMLDQLVLAAGNRHQQANILTPILRKATPRQAKWLTQMILKNMKHGCGEGIFFKHWHIDAQKYYDSQGMSLRKVFNDLTDEYKPAISSITPGVVINAQLALTTFTPENALEKLRLYEKTRLGIDPATASAGGGVAGGAAMDFSFLIETKFDGERIQVHRVGNTVMYLSRVGYEHGKKSQYLVSYSINRDTEDANHHDTTIHLSHSLNLLPRRSWMRRF
jgi:DNA ligase-4